MLRQLAETFREISPADFFYRNRDVAGFSNPSRAVYSTVRELVENSLDACETRGILPDIFVKISSLQSTQVSQATQVLKILVSDNGSGIPPQYVPQAFGQVLFGSKYVLKQMRGTFGLGGKMAYLYGQITTNTPLRIVTSTGSRAYEFTLMIDIQRNRPKIIGQKEIKKLKKWRGTLVEFSIEGDYYRASPKIVDYLRQTSMVAPYANITFVDIEGRLIRFTRATNLMPKMPKETLPHPHGIDVENLQRIIELSKEKNMLQFLTRHFHRVGKATAKLFLGEVKIDARKDPRKLSHDEIVELARALRSFEGFLPPDASCLSPLGESLLEAGIKKELQPEFVAVESRKPSAYSGHPFIVEVGVAYGGKIPQGGVSLYRFANRIPLLYDESSDVSWKVVNQLMNWKRYNVDLATAPLAVVVHICSTKIPYKTVGKEYVADRPEIEREIMNAMRDVARRLSLFLSRRLSYEREKRRFDVFERYLPKTAKYAAMTVGLKSVPSVKPLLIKASKISSEMMESDEEKEIAKGSSSS
ncbi:MAG: DNA topoisomerase VI subunit B [Thermoproteota archaeon]